MPRMLSIHGKADRFEWWVTTILFDIVAQLAGLFGALHLTSGDIRGNLLGGFLIIIAVAAVWICIAVTIRRLRDRERPAWAFALGLIPVVGWIWLLVECGFLSPPQHGAKRILVRRTVSAADTGAGNRALPGTCTTSRRDLGN